jgi:hypothetical protein
MPDVDTEASVTLGTAGSAEQGVGAMSGDVQGAEGESPQAKQAKAEALEHARAARAAAARYARLARQAGARNPNLQMNVLADPYDAMEVQSRIGRTEMALAATVVTRQIERKFLPNEKDLSQRVGGAVLSWVPLMLLNPGRRGGGLWGFVSDPRWGSFGLIAVITATREVLKDRLEKGDGQAIPTPAKPTDEELKRLIDADSSTGSSESTKTESSEGDQAPRRARR